MSSMLLQRGSIEEVQPSIFALTSETEYSKDVGLMVEQTLFEPKDLII